jgi:leader peptidase (prepilin peptidase)/N-methyltransferase
MPVLGEAVPFAGGLAWPLAATVSGLIAGSVANAAIERLPRDEPFDGPFFRCGACRAREPFVDAIPIVGWLARGGRCRFCRSHIATQNPVVEAVTGVLWLLIAGAFPPSLRAFAVMLFVTALLVLSLIDLEHHLLPDLITLPGVVIGIGATWIPGWPVTFIDSALSAAVGYFAMMALAKAAEMYYREEALGQGDWKMVAMLGAFMGSSKLVVVVLAANILGALIGLLLVAVLGDEGRQKLPLGTFLGAAGIVTTLI